MREEDLASLVFEKMLLTRISCSGYRPYLREIVLDRSATVLISRLEKQPGMTVSELSNALGLDISTVHRQIASTIKQGFIYRKESSIRCVNMHYATELGIRVLHDELNSRKAAVENIVGDWSDEEVHQYMMLMRKFNRGVEALRSSPWPREENVDFSN
nr:MarR family winged helix-turn-helix transcriptional regulator [Corynebacterium lactis]